MRKCTGMGCKSAHCPVHGICELFCGDFVHVREPDMFHNHWGVQFWVEDGIDCYSLNRIIERVAEKAALIPFHQGGFHQGSESCSGRHYWEFWGLRGTENHEETISSFVKEVENKSREGR